MKSNLLVINSSGRSTRSLSRRLTERFVEIQRSRQPDTVVVRRDLAQNPPPGVDERWIEAAFANPTELTPTMGEALRLSEELIAELSAADCILMGAPIYNFGMPAQLKAYFDQVIRVGRTFAFAPATEEPYRPMLQSKPVIVVTAAGDGAMFPGGAMHHLNFLEPHLTTVLGFIGFTDVTFVRVGYEEYQDERLQQSLRAAETTVDALAARAFERSPTCR